MSGRVITIIVLIAIVFIYVLYNTQSVGVRFLFWETHAPKALIGPDHSRVLSGWGHCGIRLGQDRSV